MVGAIYGETRQSLAVAGEASHGPKTGRVRADQNLFKSDRMIKHVFHGVVKYAMIVLQSILVRLDVENAERRALNLVELRR